MVAVPIHAILRLRAPRCVQKDARAGTVVEALEHVVRVLPSALCDAESRTERMKYLLLRRGFPGQKPPVQRSVQTLIPEGISAPSGIKC